MGMLILLVVLAVAAVGGILIFNTLIQKRQMVDNGWSDIDVQLKRRADLIPSLIEVVKGYAAHEKTTFDDVIARRNDALSADNQTELRSEKEAALSRGVGKLIALAEAYPDLKANEQFLKLQQELSKTEDEISYARRFFNGAVREYNTAIQTFPNNVVAGMMGYIHRAYFQADASDRELPSVSLGGQS